MNMLLVYLQTRKTASWLAEKMSRDGHAVALLSGDLTVDQRIAVLDRFRDGKEKVLITTNVLARGESSRLWYMQKSSGNCTMSWNKNSRKVKIFKPSVVDAGVSCPFFRFMIFCL